MTTMENPDILVIGGGPAGIVAALTARRYYPDKTVLLAKSVANGVVPCGIPYMAASLKSPDENALTSAPLLKNGVEVFCGEAVSIDRGQKSVRFADGSTHGYKKLVLAAGSTPFMPKISGAGLGGVFRIYKNLDLLKKMFASLAATENVAVLGGGFIGVELADELAKAGRRARRRFRNSNGPLRGLRQAPLHYARNFPGKIETGLLPAFGPADGRPPAAFPAGNL